MRIRSSSSLVVIEFSGTWPRWLKPEAGGDIAVVAQHYEGRPGSLVTQVASRMTRLEAVGWSLDTVIVVSNGRSDADALAARSILARGLLSRLNHLGKGHLTLSVDERIGKRAAADLRGLACSLESSLGGASVTLSTRIGDRLWRAGELSPDVDFADTSYPEPASIAG